MTDPKHCSICGEKKAVQIDGTYWMCGPCAREAMDEYETKLRYIAQFVDSLRMKDTFHDR